MRLALIQLISEQTMQNVLPMLALRPAKVIHLATPKTAGRSSHIVEAARQALSAAEVENIRLSEMPSIPETSRAVLRSIAEARSLGLTPVVNFTGGTKLMSIGAYEAAMREEVVSLYVDTDHQQFLDGHTGSKLNTVMGDDFSFTPFQRVLSVEAIAMANGRRRISGGRDWKPFLALARHLLGNSNDEEATWRAVQGPDGLCPFGREPRNVGDWLLLLERPLALPQKVAGLALALKMVRSEKSAFLLPDTAKPKLEELSRAEKPSPSEYFAAVRSLQSVLTFLSGGWWEVAVADAAERSGQFRDLRWSVSVGEPSGKLEVEEDIVGVDGVGIAYFSCKRGGARARLVPLLDELDNRAQAIGGRFTRRFLAVYQPLLSSNLANLQRRARELNGIRILTPADLDRPASFAYSHS